MKLMTIMCKVMTMLDSKLLKSYFLEIRKTINFYLKQKRFDVKRKS